MREHRPARVDLVLAPVVVKRRSTARAGIGGGTRGPLSWVRVVLPC